MSVGRFVKLLQRVPTAELEACIILLKVILIHVAGQMKSEQASRTGTRDLKATTPETTRRGDKTTTIVGAATRGIMGAAPLECKPSSIAGAVIMGCTRDPIKASLPLLWRYNQ